MAQQIGLPIKKCASHRLNLEVCEFYTSDQRTFHKIKEFMVELWNFDLTVKLRLLI